MSESEGRDQRRRPSAGKLLALHAEHREGLHATPRADCIQCTFDGLARHDGDGTEPVSEFAPKLPQHS